MVDVQLMQSLRRVSGEIEGMREKEKLTSGGNC